jgi:hypothetical protein
MLWQQKFPIGSLMQQQLQGCWLTQRPTPAL